MTKEIVQITLRKNERYSGSPWVFLSQISNQSTLAIAEDSAIAHLYDARGLFLGSCITDKYSKLALRQFSKSAVNDFSSYLQDTIAHLFKIREQFRYGDFYRLCNYEGDNLPGLCIDRFGDYYVIQATIPTFYDHYKSAILELLPNAKGVVYNNNIIFGNVPQAVKIQENGVEYLVDLLNSQKTGWYYDQRENRSLIQALSCNKSVLDSFCFQGGFGLNALLGGASSVTFVDSSQSAITACKENVSLNKFQNEVHFHGQSTYDFLAQADNLYDIVILDPPPMIKALRDKPQALKKYVKLLELAVPRVASHGFLLLSTCSHHCKMGDLERILKEGFKTSKTPFKILKRTTHAKDHPTHQKLTETVYLNSILVQKLV